MKYDHEYDSYRFSSADMNVIVNALEFYKLYNPSEQTDISYISTLIKDFEKSKQIPIDQ